MSKKTIMFNGTIKNNKIVFDYPDYFSNSVKELEGKEIVITIKCMNNRSVQQNSYLWGVVYLQIQKWYKEINGETLTLNEIHMYVKQCIMGDILLKKTIDDKEIFYFKEISTAKMSVKDFNEMIDKIIYHFSKKGLIIDPQIIN